MAFNLSWDNQIPYQHSHYQFSEHQMVYSLLRCMALIHLFYDHERTTSNEVNADCVADPSSNALVINLRSPFIGSQIIILVLECKVFLL
jgi:hypothetical protein